MQLRNLVFAGAAAMLLAPSISHAEQSKEELIAQMQEIGTRCSWRNDYGTDHDRFIGCLKELDGLDMSPLVGVEYSPGEAYDEDQADSTKYEQIISLVDKHLQASNSLAQRDRCGYTTKAIDAFSDRTRSIIRNSTCGVVTWGK